MTREHFFPHEFDRCEAARGRCARAGIIKSKSGTRVPLSARRFRVAGAFGRFRRGIRPVPSEEDEILQ